MSYVKYSNRNYEFDDADVEYDGLFVGYFVDDPSENSSVRVGEHHTSWHDDTANATK
jgi:hypothetical protein